MNVGELLRERDRLLAVVEEAKTAKVKLRQLNVLIAMYGEDEKVSLNGTVPVAVSNEDYDCPECDRTFETVQGVTMHRVKVHDYRKAY
jgi:hypothetical protein